MKQNIPLASGNFIGFPVVVASAIGLNESIFLNQLHYWLQRSNNERDGFIWVYKTIEEWKEEFPFWSDSTIKRLKKDLEKRNFLMVANYNKMKMDRTLWYRIDYEKLYDALGQNEPMEDVKMTQCTGQNEPMEDVKMTQAITIDYTETTTNKKDISIQQAESFNSWWDLFNKKTGKAQCEKKFKQLLKRYDYSVIEQGTKRYLLYLQQNNIAKQYQKNPLTFLNGEHFNDEYETVATTSSPVNGQAQIFELNMED